MRWTPTGCRANGSRAIARGRESTPRGARGGAGGGRSRDMAGVTNALKYGPAEERVEVEMRGEEDSVVLQVRNGGAPIPPEALPHVFEPLRTRDQRWNDREHGAKRSVGLGLFIVHEIARAHGGTVAVASSPGSGTVFTVRLPRHPSPSAATAG